ncbi:rhombosortase [Aquabacterium sp.]|uniref:rhombosortase n=1 Tax=Aquabacterium sp. TaxID=1872578 RepID=UPI002C517575|nr:rhombosortase [Aquabacterium sp.]HSW07889.1 rhombosortase [Aquabacterium sp.]
MPTARLDWQPGLAAGQPWRWWTAAFVHWSALHLGANLLGLVLVALLGAAAACRGRAVAAWLLAWPLTHLGLLLQPALRHYGGLSGVLHAGVAVAAVALLRQGARPRRWIGIALLAGLLLKVLLESPWLGPLRHVAGWDIPIAPLAHATGALAGALCGWLLLRR